MEETNMNKKKLLALLMALVMTLTLLPATALADDDLSLVNAAEISPAAPKKNIPIIAADTGAATINLGSMSVFDKESLRSMSVGTADIPVVYTFTAKYGQGTEKCQEYLDQFADWSCDFEVSFDRDIPANSMGLFGSYGQYINIAFLLPLDITAGTKYHLLSDMGFDNYFKYSQVVYEVGTFTCGVFNVSEDNYGAEMTVKLVAREDSTDDWTIISETPCTFNADNLSPITDKNGKGDFLYDATGDYNIVGTAFENQAVGEPPYYTFKRTNYIPVSVGESENVAVDVYVDGSTDTKTEAELTATTAEKIVDIIAKKQDVTIPEDTDSTLVLVVERDNAEAVDQSITYNVDPYAIVNNDSANKVQLTNDDLSSLGGSVTFTFRLPVPTAIADNGDQVQVKHVSEDTETYPTETFVATVEDGYVTITTTHFSAYTLTNITRQEGMYVVNLDTGIQYGTLEAAIEAVGDGETLALLDDITNAVGISVPSNKHFTVDFNGKTYTLNNPGAGSSGTETNGFQLLKDSTITFKNGTINIAEDNINPATAPAKNIMRIIQNYANLTLDNMVIDAANQYGGKDYPVSFNNGTSIIKDTTIQGTGAGDIAFDVCRYASYDSVDVTVTGNSVINGDVEIYASGSDAKNGFGLTLESGTLTGDILVDNTAKAAMLDSPDITQVKKENTFSQEPAAGYKWTDNNDGTSSLELVAYGERLGVSLRRRVKSAERHVVVNTSTDYRVGYQWFLPSGAVVNTTDSTLYWSKDGENWIPVTMAKIDGNTTYLVITGIPEGAFDTDIYTKLELHYTLNEQNLSVVIGANDGADNVKAVAGRMTGLTGDANAPWVQYARYLLHEIDSLTIS